MLLFKELKSEQIKLLIPISDFEKLRFICKDLIKRYI